MKTVALLTALSLATCAPAHANPLSYAAIRMCNGFTQITMAHVEYGFAREETDALVADKITNPDLAQILMGMLDIADDPNTARMFLESEVHTKCLADAIGMIEAAQ